MFLYRIIIVSTIAMLSAVAAEAQVTYQKTDSITVCRLLSQCTAETTTLWFARQFAGKPYVAHTLEVNDEERLVVNTRQLDCTTLVETVCALKLCANEGKRRWEDYLAKLQLLRYRHGLLDGYTSRLHYFTDWIQDKAAMGIVDDIQQPIPPFTAVCHVRVSYMSQHPTAYKALKAKPALVPTIRQQEQALSQLSPRYIPKSAIKNTALLRSTVHDGDIIAITCNKPGLDIAHLGFAVWRKDGLHLLNASQLHKKVIEEPMTLYQYMQKHPSFTGIRIVRIAKN